jgi:hypothetical protein
VASTKLVSGQGSLLRCIRAATLAWIGGVEGSLPSADDQLRVHTLPLFDQPLCTASRRGTASSVIRQPQLHDAQSGKEREKSTDKAARWGSCGAPGKQLTEPPAGPRIAPM